MAEKLEVTPVVTPDFLGEHRVIGELARWGVITLTWMRGSKIYLADLTEAGRYVLENESKKLLDVTV